MRILELREQRNLTQNDVARAINTSRTNIGRWEKDENEPTASSIIALANFFQCSTDYLLGREDDFGNVTIINGTESLPTTEQALLVTFRSLPPDLQRRASAYLARLGELAEDEKTSTIQPRSKKGENLC